jgi:tetratricopeptide (TPR) repeat protein
MKTNLITVVIASVLIVFSSKTFPQNSSQNALLKKGKALTEQAYASYNQDLFLNARKIFEQIYDSSKTNLLPLYYMTFIDYKLLEMSLRQQGDEQFNKYYDGAEKNALQIVENKDWESEGKTLLAAIYMMKIAKSPMAAISLAPKIAGLMAEAEKSNPVNPRAYLIDGMMKFNTPKTYGGSFEIAADNFRKAVSIYEKQDTTYTLQPSWGYLEALTWLGRSLDQLDNAESAKFYYQKVLSIQPEYGFVKYYLLPNLEKKIKEKN